MDRAKSIIGKAERLKGKAERFELYNARMGNRGYPAPANTQLEAGTFAGATEGEYIFSWRESLVTIRERLWVILLVTIVLMGAAWGFSLAQTPKYQASITILVGQERGITEAPEDVMGLQQLTQTMAVGVSSRPVAEAVIRQEDLRMTTEELLEGMSVEQIPDTQFIRVGYTDTDPERARRVANAVGEAFSERISEVSSNANSITASVWEPAATPNDPVSPNPVRNGLLGLAVGLMLGLALGFLLEYLDDTWRSPEEVESISGVPTLAVIPEAKVAKDTKRGY